MEDIFEDKSNYEGIHAGAQDAIKTFKEATATGQKLNFDSVAKILTTMNTNRVYKFIKPEIDDLRQIITHLDTCFHITGEECINPITGDIVLDNEYDALRQRLEQLDPLWEGFDTVFSADEEIVGKTVIHNPPMTSISKCNGTQDEKENILIKWMNDCLTNIPHTTKGFIPGKLNLLFAEGTNKFSMSFKHDGIALCLVYKDGKLISAGVRGKDGVNGIDVTAKTKNIKNIPQTLSLPLTITVRGEIETHVSLFNQINQKLEAQNKPTKKHPRAYTAGAMNRKTAAEMKGMGLSFVGYNIINHENPPYKTEIERAKWAEEELKFTFVKTIPFSLAHLKAFEEVHRQLDFKVDGVVVSVNNLEDQEALGTHGNRVSANPKGKMAFKFADEVKEAIVISITWQTGRTGTLTPVLNFEGIELEGTTVSKCTAHNLGLIKQNKIGIGSRVAIIKSGKIIPKIKEVIEAKGKVEFPNTCPSCGLPTKEVKGNNNTLSLVCENMICPAQTVQNLNHYLKRIGVKGIAVSTITKLCEAGLINEPADFYKLTLDTIRSIGFRERSATLILARIKMIVAPEQEKDNSVLILLLDKIKNKKIPIKMETFIAALGIDGAGRELGRIMAEHYDNFEAVRHLSPTELEMHDGIGPITASNVCRYFTDYSAQVDNLLEFIKIEVAEKKSGKLDGKKICLSGAVEGGKAKWKTLIENNGGTVSSSVSKKTDYLVAGDGSGAKSDKATTLGIPILTTEDLEKMI